MTRSPALIDRDSWTPYFGLVFFCGIALVLSVPGARVVRDLAYVQHFTRTVGLDMTRVFLDSYVLCLGFFGLRLGSASSERGERGWSAILRLALRVLLGQLCCLPYLVFSRALLPGRDAGLALTILLATLTSLLCAMLNRLVEEPASAASRPFTGYALFLGVAFAPFVGIPILSPLGAARLLVDGATPAQALFALAAPAALLAVLFLLASWLRGLTRG